MSDSIRQQIMTAVLTRLAGILKTADYQTDLGQHVYEWRYPPLEAATLPAVIVKDLDEVPSMLTVGKSGYTLHDLKVELSIVDAAGSSTPADLRKALADVIEAIGTDTTWGGLATRTNPAPNDMDVAQADRIVGAFRLTLSIQYQTQKWNPYG